MSRKKKFKMIWEPESQAYRIYALRSFNRIVEGEAGGLISRESNLSHYGDCWVYPGSEVTGYSRISHNVEVRGESHVEGSIVKGDCLIIDAFVRDSIIKGKDDLIIMGNVYKCRISGSIRVLPGINLRNLSMISTSIRDESKIDIDRNITDQLVSVG